MNKRMFIVAVVLAGLLAMGKQGWAAGSPTTYYVSQSSGNDAADGKSQAAAWKTLAKASQGKYGPGDRILLKCGDTWGNDTLQPQGCGTPENPIVISSYGTGNKPVLDGLDGKQDRIGIHLVDVEGYKIMGLEFARYRSGVFAHYGVDKAPKRYLWIEDCYFHDSTFYANYRNYLKNKPGLGIILWTDETKQRIVISDITIKNCRFERMLSAIWSNNPDNFNRKADGIWNFGNLVIDGCSTDEGLQWQIGLRGIAGGAIRNCVFHDTGRHFKSFNGVAGSMLQRCRDLLIDNCEWGEVSIGDPGNISSDGETFDFEDDCLRITVRNCLFHDSDGPGFTNGFAGTGITPNREILMENCVYNGKCRRMMYYPHLVAIAKDYLCQMAWVDSRIYLGPREQLTDHGESLTLTNCIVKPLSQVCSTANLAKGARASASTSAADHEAAAANDGNTASVWKAAAGADQWLQLDFGRPATINVFRIKEDASSSIARYVIECWDDKESRWIGCFNGLKIGPDFIAPIVSRTTTKARLLVKRTDAGNPAITEFEAYNDTLPGKSDPLLRALEVGDLLNCDLNAMCPLGNSEYMKQIARQGSGSITLEFRFMLRVPVDGACWELRDLSEAGVRLITAGSNLCYEGADGALAPILACKPGRTYGVKAEVNITTRKVLLFIDGERRLEASFRRPIETIDELRIKTGNAATGKLWLSPVNLYKGYRLCETFVTCGSGKVPDGWRINGGAAAVREFNCAPGPDIFSLKLETAVGSNRVSAVKAFDPVAAKTVFECRFLMPRKEDGMRIELQQGGTTVAWIGTVGGRLVVGTADAGSTDLLPDYRPDFWYMLRMVADPAARTVDLFLNGKSLRQGVPLPERFRQFDGVSFAAAGNGLWLDDLRVYPWRDFPADYVPAPKPSPAQSPYLLGLLTCDMNKDTAVPPNFDGGWDWIHPFADKRKPLLGWYDEHSPEATDWQIKWQVEHGIGFVLECWYRTANARGFPVKNTAMDHSMIPGLFNSRYGHLRKFAIMFENGGRGVYGHTDQNDFRDHIIPYWIEYFFKDPRYLKIDNKPVVSIRDLPNFLKDFGGVDGARLAVAELRRACVETGFAGAVVWMEDSKVDQPDFQQMKSLGVDACYTRTWGKDNATIQRRKNQDMRDAAVAVGFPILPILSMGWDEEPLFSWRKGPGWMKVQDYQQQARWLRDEFMPTFPADSPGRQILMLDNWNEFAEGHFIMPSALAGFGYLDALREVFCGGGTHNDSVPTEQQRRRFRVLNMND